MKTTVLSDSNLLYYRLGESRHDRLTQSDIETFFRTHEVAVTSVTVVEWISKHAGDLAAIQKLLIGIDLTDGPKPIGGLYVEPTLLTRIRDAQSLAEVQDDIAGIVEQRIQAEAEMLRFTLVFLVLAFDVGVAEARLVDPIRQATVIEAMAAVLQANLDFLKDSLVAALRSLHGGVTKRADLNKAICSLIASLAQASLINYHSCVNGVGLSPDMDMTSILSDPLYRKVVRATDPLETLRAVGNKDVRRAAPSYLSRLRAILSPYRVGPQTIEYWCTRLAKTLQDDKIPDKNDMLDMLVLDAVKSVENGVVVTADAGFCNVLKEHHPSSYDFIKEHLPDALP